MNPPPRRTPLLVYDGDCGFCVRWIQRWQHITRDRVEYAPAARVIGRVDGVTADNTRASVVLVQPDGSLRTAADAVFQTLATSPRWRWTAWCYDHVPGVRTLTETGYRFVASQRQPISLLERLLVGNPVLPDWRHSRALFVRGLALVCLIAFCSAWVQVDGLLGSGGILPVADELQSFTETHGEDAALRLRPTLLWLDPSDAMLHGVCALGVTLSLLALLGVASGPAFLVLWVLYLSLVQAGGAFLAFQWDTLLVETCLLGALYAPWVRLRTGADSRAPPWLGRLLIGAVLFRLMFESGVTKLTSGDPTWQDATALTFHYWTQPLPHGLSWFAHHLPDAIQRVCAQVMLMLELVFPFLLLGPRRVRHLGAAGMAALMLLIAATGNFGFFNLLTLVLCLAVVDDSALCWLVSGPSRLVKWARLPRRGRTTDTRQADAGLTDTGSEENSAPVSACGLPGGELPAWKPERKAPLLQRLALLPLALITVPIGATQVLDAASTAPDRITRQQLDEGVLATLADDGWLAATRVLDWELRPLLSVNAYGLFRVMTTARPEIAIQVRDKPDGLWRDVDFRYKPDLLSDRPAWMQPHMPRLDWRLWFEALEWERAGRRSPWQPSHWFGRFLQTLLEDAPDVVALLRADPCPDGPPERLRIGLFWYAFTTPEERTATGAWWTREQAHPWIEVNLPRDG